MTVVMPLDLEGGQVRAALLRWSPAEVPAFDREFRQALNRAGDSFDLRDALAVVARWRRIATVRSAPLSEAELELVSAARAGRELGLYEQGDDGTFRQLG